MRPVEVKQYKTVPRTSENYKGLVALPPKRGAFHQFSTGYVEFDSGPGHFPVAIVEFEDGTVEEVTLENMRFTDKLRSVPNG